MVQMPNFEFGTVFFTAIGAILFWAKWGQTKLRTFALSSLIEVFVKNESTKLVVEFVVFVTLGCVVGIGLVDPQTAPQSFAAGLGWTALFARHDPQ
jgi:hypothetical protein